MSNEITKVDLDKQDKLELLKRTICKGSTNDEFELFVHACKRTGLDPFMRQIYAVKRWSDGKESMTIQTGIDGYRLIAERTGKYMPGKQSTFEYGANKTLISATAYVKKKDSDGQWHEIAHTVYWDEYCARKKDGNPMIMWKDKPHVMLGKCAEAAVLRKAFPADLSGVYTHEEMQQASHTEINSDAEIVAEPAPETTIGDEKAKILSEIIGSNQELLQRILNAFGIERLEDMKERNYLPTIKRLETILLQSGESLPE